MLLIQMKLQPKLHIRKSHFMTNEGSKSERHAFWEIKTPVMTILAMGHEAQNTLIDAAKGLAGSDDWLIKNSIEIKIAKEKCLAELKANNAKYHDKAINDYREQIAACKAESSRWRKAYKELRNSVEFAKEVDESDTDLK